MENKSWNELGVHGLVPLEHTELLRDLQDVHDSNSAAEWEAALLVVATEHGLNYTHAQ